MTFNDHRIAMTFHIASIISGKEIKLDNAECVNISFPAFLKQLKYYKMKNISVIGSPIEHSLSPYLHQEIYKEIGKKIISTKVHVSKAKLRTFVNNHKNDFYNVTIPHKEKILPFLESVDVSADEIGAVNCVAKLKGYNTDWIGFKKLWMRTVSN